MAYIDKLGLHYGRDQLMPSRKLESRRARGANLKEQLQENLSIISNMAEGGVSEQVD